MPANDQAGILRDIVDAVMGGASGLRHELPRGAHIVEMPEFVLQRLQSLHECLDFAGLEKAAKALDHVAELLNCDAELMPLSLREFGEAFAPFSRLAPAP